MSRSFDALLFDAGGILVLPDPTVLAPLLEYYGGDPSLDRHVRAHYRGMAMKSAAGSAETFWDDYNHAYADAIGVPSDRLDAAAAMLGRTRTANLWRWPIPASLETLRALAERGVPLGVVSNASGQIEEVLLSSGVCQVGAGVGVEMRVIVDSHVVGYTKPDPRIFEVALVHFSEFERSRIAYIGDSVTMDIGGARAAGLHPILLDPHDDHPDADFDRIRSLTELLDR